MIYSPVIQGGSLKGTDSLEIGLNTNLNPQTYNMKVERDGSLYIGPYSYDSNTEKYNYNFKVDASGHITARELVLTGNAAAMVNTMIDTKINSNNTTIASTYMAKSDMSGYINVG